MLSMLGQTLIKGNMGHLLFIGAPHFRGDHGTSETFNSFEFSVNVFTKFSAFSDKKYYTLIRDYSNLPHPV